MEQTLNVLDIIDGTSVDGPGLRTSIYFAGCDHHCPGCHNPESWNPNGGTPTTVARLLQHIAENNMPVTLSGGDPLQQDSQALLSLLKGVKALGLDLWCYTGYTYEQIISDPRLLPMLDYIDVVVDGPFMLPLRDTSLIFKGSSNQRLIDVRKTGQGKISLWESDF